MESNRSRLISRVLQGGLPTQLVSKTIVEEDPTCILLQMLREAFSTFAVWCSR